MSDKAIKISIIVPIYNVEDYVKPCIESVMGQSYRNLEIILVDDGSTDSCPEICDDYAKKDERIHVIHKRNGGLVSARKAGVATATGDYVLNVDGDDWIEDDRVEVLVRDGIMPTNADMIYLAGYIADNKGKEGKLCNFNAPVKLFEKDEIENKIFPLIFREDMAFKKTIRWMLWMWAVRRELLLKNQMLVDDRVTDAEDLLCTCFCLLDAKSVMTTQQGGYHRVQRASSITHQLVPFSDESLLQSKIWYQVLKNQLKQKCASEEIQKICDHIMIYSLMMTNYDLLLQRFPDYLFPFPNVGSGARIVVYGAGNFGNHLVESLDKMKKYSLVLWVDQDQHRPTMSGYTISSRDAIFSVDYDYIVVAIINATVAEEVKRSLILDGIPEGKIVTMDASIISEDAIPDEIRNFQI